MDNILFVGPYREFSGIGNASRNYIKSLIKTGSNISIRPIYNLSANYEEVDLDQDIIELEANYSKKYHTIIQHCYPHQLLYNNKFDKHIGILHFESCGYKSSVLQYLDIVDSIIVGSDFIKNDLKSKIKSSISTVPEPVDLEEIYLYKNASPSKNRSSYNFYIIADWISRKNILDVVLAFANVASYYPNIELVIKTKSYNSEDADLHNVVEYDLSRLYSSMSYKVKPKIVLGKISQEGMYYIHNNNDCYINMSSGESFSYSSLEALAFNNNIIVSRKTSQENFAKNDCGLIVNTEIDNCFDNAKMFPMYNSNKQYWSKPIIKSIEEKMFEALQETKDKKQKRIGAQSQQIKHYTIDSVAEQLKTII
jgi:glycosyltransferase involved in cell wall biosynthesis